MLVDHASPLLEVTDLTVGVAERRGAGPNIIEGLDLRMDAAETLALVGESGCGKTTAALSLMGLVPPGLVVRSGSVRFSGQELTGLSERAYRRLRGGPMAMVFQDPMNSLNPLRRVGSQIAEALNIHDSDGSRRDHRERSVELLRSVGIPDPGRRARQYPHEFSGGMRQRAMIALAIANRPRLLVADEPTTALDVTIQAQIIELLVEAREATGAALILVTHDLGLVEELADRVAVMYAGRVVEVDDTSTILRTPHHPYTVGLLDSVPRLSHRQQLAPIPGQAPLPGARPSGCAFHPRCPVGVDRPQCRRERPLLTDRHGHAVACHFPDEASPSAGRDVVEHRAPVEESPLLELRDVRVEFPVSKGMLRRRVGTVHAVAGVDLTVAPGETVAVVGESGSGKTTVARAIVGLADVAGGQILLDGTTNLLTDRRQQERRRVQLVFQDPYGSLNPRMTLGAIVGEPLRVHGSDRRASRRARVDELFDLVGLDPAMRDRYPHELSGGQRQRIGLARALALDPDLIVLDEPVSALDVSVQAQILALLSRLQTELGLAYLLIAHDLALVEQIAHRVAVMYFGRFVEVGTTKQVLGDPQHPYTRALIASTPGAVGRADDVAASGEPPSPLDPPEGCPFHSRCPLAIDECRAAVPALRGTPGGSLAACIRTDEPRASAAARGLTERVR